ncbi:antA/AntB antirepressor family protein [Salmonella enterica]|nr:antA/AntB antirepressor family protein [Salmonella enterica]
MTNQLIPVFNGTINNESVLLCDARELHNFLGVGKRFASWITDRIEQYGFIENQDYIAISQNREIGHGRGKIDYHLTLDTAKETAMVERNEKGRQIRRYFIECEKQLRQQSQQPVPVPKPLIHTITLTDEELCDMCWL